MSGRPAPPVEEAALHVNSRAADAAAVTAVLETFGVRAPLGQPFSSVVPGHPGRAEVRLDERTGLYHYYPTTGGRFTLAEVHAARASGELKPLSDGLTVNWYRRAFSDAGVIEPLLISLPQLPEGERPVVHRVRDGFALLLGLRWLTHPGESVMFARAFAGAWCSMSLDNALSATRRLRRLEVILLAGKHEPAGRNVPPERWANLYRPGGAA